MVITLTATVQLLPAGESRFSIFTGPQQSQSVDSKEQQFGFLQAVPQGSSVLAPGYRIQAPQLSASPRLVR